MKKMKVYLQSPLGISDSLYYKNILNFPPKNISYSTNITTAKIITSKHKFKLFNLAKKTIRETLCFLNFPFLNIYSTKNIENEDLLHCAHCLSYEGKKSWVADFEAPWQFWISGRDTKIGKKKFLEVVQRKNCKKLIAWTEEAKKEMITKFPSLREKIAVVSYAMPFIPSKKPLKKEKITLLFSARYFYQKGGLHALAAIDSLTKKYSHVDAIVVSEVPKKILEKYRGNKKIKFLGLIPQKKLFEEVYPNADIFVYPGYTDTFGFGFVEAMNFGLPIITVDGYARKEIVDSKCGFVIDSKRNIDFFKLKGSEEIVREIEKKTAFLIEHKDLLRKMSARGIEEIKNGKFSITERNKKLKRIYEEATKN